MVKFSEMSTLRKVFICVFSVLIVATLGFIWGNSLVPETASAEESGNVYGFIEPLIEATFGKNVITEAVLRKLAHFSEFFLLAFEASFLFITLKIYKLKPWFILLAAGIFVALIDETLQAIVGRGAMVTDIWIDEGGFFAASLLIGGIYALVYALKNRKKQDGGGNE